MTGSAVFSGFFARYSRTLSLVLVLIASTRIVATYIAFSHTFDETAHIATGMEWLDKGVYTLEPQHPPLARIAAALGPFFLGERLPDTLADMKSKGLAILCGNDRYTLTLTFARLGILPFFWIACLVVYLWGRWSSGPQLGMFSVFVFSNIPPVLAHAGLATTDMALAAFLGAAFFCGARWLAQPSPSNAVWFGLSVGLSVISKLSSLVFLPACFGVGLLCYFLAEHPQRNNLKTNVRLLIPGLLLAVLVGFVVVWSAYRFSVGEVSRLHMRVPFPELFHGIQEVWSHNTRGHPAYLFGHRSRSGFVLFYPIALAVKTPAALLLLFGLGLVMALRHRMVRTQLPLAFMLGVLLVGAATRINIGVRHILPVYMGISIIAAAAITRLTENAFKARLILAGLLAWFTISSIRSHPDYLAYFNELGGAAPERILVDSDLDWGQDSKRLAKRLKEVGAKEVSYVTLPVVNSEGYPVLPKVNLHPDPLHPEPGWNAVGFTVWKSQRLGLLNARAGVALWPDRVPAGERIGKSIMLWYFPPDAEVLRH